MAGNSHALDRGKALGTLVVRYAALRGGLDAVDDAEQRREAWAAVGVLQDELSAPVLALNLRAAGEGKVARALALHADEGEPYRLSTRQLCRARPTFAREVTGPVVFACKTRRSSPRRRTGSAPAARQSYVSKAIPVSGAPAVDDAARGGDRGRLPRRLRLGRPANRQSIIGRLDAEPWRFDREHYVAHACAGQKLEGIQSSPLGSKSTRRDARESGSQCTRRR